MCGLIAWLFILSTPASIAYWSIKSLSSTNRKWKSRSIEVWKKKVSCRIYQIIVFEVSQNTMIFFHTWDSWNIRVILICYYEFVSFFLFLRIWICIFKDSKLFNLSLMLPINLALVENVLEQTQEKWKIHYKKCGYSCIYKNMMIVILMLPYAFDT